MKNTITSTFWACCSIVIAIMGMQASQLSAGMTGPGFMMQPPDIRVTDNIHLTNPFGTYYLKQTFFDDSLTVTERQVRTTNGDGFRIREMLRNNVTQIISEKDGVNLILKMITSDKIYIENAITGESGVYSTSQLSGIGNAADLSWYSDMLNFVDYETQRAAISHLLIKNTTDGVQACNSQRSSCEWLDVAAPWVVGGTVVVACTASTLTLGALVAACGTSVFGFLQSMRTFREACAGCDPVATIDDNNHLGNSNGNNSGPGGTSFGGGHSNYGSNIDHTNPQAWTCQAPYYVDTNPYDDEFIDSYTVCGQFGF